MKRLAALMAVTALAVAGCGGSDGDDNSGGTGGARASSSTTRSVAEVSTSAPAAGPTTSPSTAPTTRATTATTTRPVVTTPTSASPPTDGSGAADQATAPGRYIYTTTGTFSSLLGGGPRNGDSTLTVSPASAGEQRSLRTGPGRTVEQVLRLQGDGAYVVMLKLTDSGYAQEVRPSPPVLAVPSPAPVGRAWSWTTTTVDGATRVQSNFKVARTETVTVGTEPVTTAVVEATITTTGGLVTTSTQTFWYSPRHRLIVQQQETTTGRVAAIDFRSESMDKLRSTSPG